MHHPIAYWDSVLCFIPYITPSSLQQQIVDRLGIYTLCQQMPQKPYDSTAHDTPLHLQRLAVFDGAMFFGSTDLGVHWLHAPWEPVLVHDINFSRLFQKQLDKVTLSPAAVLLTTKICWDDRTYGFTAKRIGRV